MKAILRFLLHTGAGKVIVQAIFQIAINLFKKKVLDKMDPYKRENLKEAFDIADEEIHAEMSQGKIDVKV